MKNKERVETLNLNTLDAFHRALLATNTSAWMKYHTFPVPAAQKKTKPNLEVIYKASQQKAVGPCWYSHKM